MNIDFYILAFSAITVVVTIWMGFRSAKTSKTASDFFVAGRSVSVGWNASAISGEYLSAASFMGIAGMVMSSGYDALWYPVCYACGYLFLLLFIAGPLRRFGAYTIPDFAEGRFDSPLFRKIAVVFVLFIGFFYTMPQMKGAGTTLAYIFPGLPYWAGVVLVGAVITLNVALGGMKGITLVQAFQYWAKMFAISVPIFVLMAVYGHYGKQVEANGTPSGQPAAAVTNTAEVARAPLPPKAPKDDPWLNPFGPLTTKAARTAAKAKAGEAQFAGVTFYEAAPSEMLNPPDAGFWFKVLGAVGPVNVTIHPTKQMPWRVSQLASNCAAITGDRYLLATNLETAMVEFGNTVSLTGTQYVAAVHSLLQTGSVVMLDHRNDQGQPVWGTNQVTLLREGRVVRIFPQGGTANPAGVTHLAAVPLRAGLDPSQHASVNLEGAALPQLLAVYSDLTGRQLLPRTNSVGERVDDLLGGKLSQWKLVARTPAPDSGVRVHNDGRFTVAEVKDAIEGYLRTNGLAIVPVGDKGFELTSLNSSATATQTAEVTAASAAAIEKAWLSEHEKPLALLYTYSLIIAIVCGTAGLPHILVRFYTNPDGVAAKRTTMWVMILIGVFYVFPPVFGVIGRNLAPELYAGVGAKGTDKIVLELPRILNEKYAPLGSILSGITCAGAFAAFMSTFSGLLVSMTGALAHDVYGRILRPKSTAEQRMRMFKIAAVLIGAIAILLGMQVEQLQINFMVGQAFAIAAASYFPLLFMAVWWRGLTMKGAAAGMLTGGLMALAGISLTSFSDLASAPNASAMFLPFAGLNHFWASHPLLRILCEQPAIWAVPLAIVLMIIVSKLTRREVPADIRMKMLVLHAPEQLGLKQEYIQEHSH